MKLKHSAIQLTAAALAVASWTNLVRAVEPNSMAVAKKLPLSMTNRLAAEGGNQEVEDTVPAGSSVIWQNRRQQEAEGARVPGGTFGSTDCPRLDRSLAALVPGRDGDAFGLFTMQERPQFWFYVPYPSDSPELILTAEFAIVDLSNDEVIYEQRESLAETPGIITVSPTVTLTEGTSYAWEFAITCGDSDRVYVSGSIERISSPIALPPPLDDRILFYARAGVWPELLASIDNLYDVDRDLARERLRQLFTSNSVNLGDFVEEVDVFFQNN